MTYFLPTAFCCIVLLFPVASFSSADQFPYREKYPEVAVIDLADLKAGYDRGDVLLIDIRSQTEFETIHIKNAVNLPYANALFLEQLHAIAEKNPARKLVVYDNGTTCIKSYKAAEDALYEMITVYVFDAGVQAWAQRYPSATLLLGAELKNPAAELISEESLRMKTVDYDTFIQLGASDNAVIIDVRDPLQRKQKLPGMPKDLHVPLDKLVRNIINKGHLKDKHLYIYDQVGAQVVWLMYYLEMNNYTDYHFLSGGVYGVVQDQDYDRVSLVH